MRFNTHINNQKAIEWGLNANQAALFDLLNQSSSWAKDVTIDGQVFYWVSRNRVIEELPLFYSKTDTVYRHFVELAKKELISYQKQGEKDLIKLTEKGKTWNEFTKSNSEIDPNELGNKSDTRKQIRISSEIDPTNNNTNNNINNTPFIPQGKNLPNGKSEEKKSNRSDKKINFEKIAELWNIENENNDSQLPFVEKVNDERKRAIKKFLVELREPTLECVEKYFKAFFAALKPHHLGENDRGWRANFDFAIKPKQVLRVREGAL
jgi:putative DNA replication protein O